MKCVLQAWDYRSANFHVILDIIYVTTNISNASYRNFINGNHLIIFLVKKWSQGSKRNPYTCIINTPKIHSHAQHVTFLCSIPHINQVKQCFMSLLLLGLILCSPVCGFPTGINKIKCASHIREHYKLMSDTLWANILICKMIFVN